MFPGGFQKGGLVAANPNWDFQPPGPGGRGGVRRKQPTPGNWGEWPWGSKPGEGGAWETIPGATAPAIPMFPQGQDPWGQYVPIPSPWSPPGGSIPYRPGIGSRNKVGPIREFQTGGLVAPEGVVIRPKPPSPKPSPQPRPAPTPRGPDVGHIALPPPRPSTAPSPPISAPAAPPTQGVAAPPTPGVPTQQPGPGGAYIQIGGGVKAETPEAGADQFMHLHPALEKGITSTASTLGNLAATAMQIGASVLGAAGGAGAGPSMGGSLGASAGAAALGGLSSYVAGLFVQGGKIAKNVANIGSSFLVGNITGGTTKNAYGVTQRGSVPSGGGARIYDSSTQIGSIQTADLDGYYAMENRRQAQRAQANLGPWGNR